MTNLRSFDRSFGRQIARQIRPADFPVRRVAPEVALRSSIHLVPKRAAFSEPISRGFRYKSPMRLADKMFVALALGGAAALCWSIW
jgi:hypothetical protein